MIVSLLVVGDSISAPTAPYFSLAGIANVPLVGGLTNLPSGCEWPYSDPETTAINRLAFQRTGIDPPLFLCNGAIPGTRLTAGNGPLSGELYAPARIDPLIRPDPRSGVQRLFILSMFYSNPSDSVAADAVARVVAWFVTRKAAALAKGVRVVRGAANPNNASLACMTMTIPSRTDGIFSETGYRVPYDNIVIDSVWQTTNGIYTVDVTGILPLSAVDAANDTANFPDNVHPVFDCIFPATAIMRTVVNQIILDFA